MTCWGGHTGGGDGDGGGGGGGGDGGCADYVTPHVSVYQENTVIPYRRECTDVDETCLAPGVVA